LRNGEVSGDVAKGNGNGVGEWTEIARSVDRQVSVAGIGSKGRPFSLRGANGAEMLDGMKGEQNRSCDSEGGDMACSEQDGRIEESNWESNLGVEGREFRLVLEFRLGEGPSICFVGVLRIGIALYLSASASCEYDEIIPSSHPLTDSLMAEGERLSLGETKTLSCPRTSPVARTSSSRPSGDILLGVNGRIASSCTSLNPVPATHSVSSLSPTPLTRLRSFLGVEAGEYILSGLRTSSRRKSDSDLL
jgi:hypothetical protein